MFQSHHPSDELHIIFLHQTHPPLLQKKHNEHPLPMPENFLSHVPDNKHEREYHTFHNNLLLYSHLCLLYLDVYNSHAQQQCLCLVYSIDLIKPYCQVHLNRPLHTLTYAYYSIICKTDFFILSNKYEFGSICALTSITRAELIHFASFKNNTLDLFNPSISGKRIK